MIAELVCALLFVGRAGPAPAGPQIAAPASLTTPTSRSTTQTLRDGRTVRLIGLGDRTAPLLRRISAQLDDAADAVTAFWGPNWPRAIAVVAAGTDAQFAAVGGGDTHTAATATGERIMFAPGAAEMDDPSLRIVLRHELFHYAARAATAVDAPRWLTEGVADFVARPPIPLSANADATIARGLPTDAELDGPQRSSAYDRAWWFTRFVADTYGIAALRDLYIRACGHGHPDLAFAMQQSLGGDPAEVLAAWRRWAKG
nr:peptidase [Mycolicibacterium rhodesiae]